MDTCPITSVSNNDNSTFLKWLKYCNYNYDQDEDTSLITSVNNNDNSTSQNSLMYLY